MIMEAEVVYCTRNLYHGPTVFNVYDGVCKLMI